MRRYSDALLALLLKAHRPHKYDRRAAAGLPAPGAIAIDVRAALLA